MSLVQPRALRNVSKSVPKKLSRALYKCDLTRNATFLFFVMFRFSMTESRSHNTLNPIAPRPRP